MAKKKTIKKTRKVSAKKRKKKINLFSRVIFNFVSNMESLESSIPIIIDILEDKLKEETDNLKDFSDKLKPKKLKNKAADHLVDNFEKIRYLLKRYERSSIAKISIPRSMFILMVTYYDSLFRELIKIVFCAFPEIISCSEKNIPVSDLFKNEDLQSLKQKIIEKETDSILRGSHADQVKWLESKLKINLRDNSDLWKKFIEITERRNILVHSDGIITEQYLNVCERNEIKLDRGIKKGFEISLNKKYFEESLDVIFEFGLKISQVIRRKINPKEKESADNDLLRISYDLLMNEKYEMVEKILNYKYLYSSEEFRLYFIINRAIALRDMGKKDESKKIISSNDLSAVDDKFKLAAAVILEQFGEAEKIMKRIKNSVDMKYAYRWWPLFDEFRKTKYFLRTYKSLFKENFNSGNNIEKLKKDMEIVKKQN